MNTSPQYAIAFFCHGTAPPIAISSRAAVRQQVLALPEPRGTNQASLSARPVQQHSRPPWCTPVIIRNTTPQVYQALSLYYQGKPSDTSVTGYISPRRTASRQASVRAGAYYYTWQQREV